MRFDRWGKTCETGDMDTKELFQETMLDHYRRPRNLGEIPVPPAHHNAGVNPACGDNLKIWVEVSADQRLINLRFIGQGCAISQASASLMTVKLAGKSVDEAQALIQAFTAMLLGADPVILPGELGLFANVREFPARITCALLPWKTLSEALP